MDIDTFLNIVSTSTQQTWFYHFTDDRNLASIKAHGILPTRALKGRAIKVGAYGGNQWSLDQDIACGMDNYVHLCFRNSHPMEHLARADGRLEATTFLRIDPQILRAPGAKITLDVSNKVGISPGDPSAQLDQMDLEVLYKRLDWRDPAVKERLKTAEKYEILIPDCVPTNFIKNI